MGERANVFRVLVRAGPPIVTAFVIAACAPADAPERVATSASPILGGRASGADEDATVIIAVEVDGVVTPQCTGQLVAPTLALTARHCVLNAVPGSACNPDGSPRDLATAGDLTLAPPERLFVQVGSDRASVRNVGARQVLTTTALSVCKADVAFIVLSEVALEVRIPIRREPVRVGETFSVSGWGQTSEDVPALPERRSTLDAVRVKDIGPGLVPVGSFACGGATLCFGDSGAAARIDGAIVGVYSRIDGDCGAEASTNVFSGLATETDLVERAFAAIGEPPRYADEDAPTVADACATGAKACPPAPTTPVASEDGGCAMTPPPRDRSPWSALAVTLAALLGARRRRR
jgi:hypothetical protein